MGRIPSSSTPSAAVAALAGVSQDVVNAFGTGHFLTGLQDFALAPTSILDGFLNWYPASPPNSFIDPSSDLLTGTTGTTQPGFGSAGLALQVIDSIAAALGTGSG